MRQDQPPLTVYAELPAAPRVQTHLTKEHWHHLTKRDRVTGTLTLAVTTVDPLHVGSGVEYPFETNRGPVLARDILLRKGAPLLPGASLKGVLRSLVEALGGGCNMEPECCGECPACVLFGFVTRRSGEHMGRVGAGDGVLRDSADADRIELRFLPRAFAPRRAAGRRLYPTPRVELPREVPMVVVPAGVTFEVPLALTNVTESELGLVLLASGCDDTFHPRAGGGKFGGLGRIAVRPERAVLRAGYDDPVPKRLDVDAIGAWVRGAIEAVRLPPGGEKALAALRAAQGTGGTR